jgi:MFS family permease
MGLSGLLYSQLSASWLVVALVVHMICGFFNGPTIVMRSLIIQRHTPAELRGRVFSAFFAERSIMFLSGMALAALADLFDVRLLYGLACGLMILTGLVVLVLPGLGRAPKAVESGTSPASATLATVGALPGSNETA